MMCTNYCTPSPTDTLPHATSNADDGDMPATVPELQAALMEARAARAAAVKELATMRRQLTHAQSALEGAQKV